MLLIRFCACGVKFCAMGSGRKADSLSGMTERTAKAKAKAKPKADPSLRSGGQLALLGNKKRRAWASFGASFSGLFWVVRS
jgi:hypothetical protein